ncbi:MAG: NAD(P)H-hydrate epimerase [Gemmatimonadetes bacterium]|nr:NAD(P)H-hydrate epimerase [Gemmatimonadota bacterium]
MSPIVSRAVRVALVVGTILVAINQGPALFGGHVSLTLAVRMALTYAVPFFVSLYAASRTQGDRRLAEPIRSTPPALTIAGRSRRGRTSQYVTAEQMIEVDRAMVEDYRIELLQMMENAGRGLAQLARDRFLDGSADRKTVIVLAGGGNNGGGALTAGRHLHNWGAEVRVFLATPPDALTGVPAHQLEILKRMGLSIAQAIPASGHPRPDVILDGLIGYRLSGAPRGSAAELIRWANAQDAPILALDVPSGVDPTSGAVFDPVIRAAATLTLALPKTGLKLPSARANVGDLYLADIGVPPGLYARLGMIPPRALFAEREIVPLR